SIGMLIEPGPIAQHWGAEALLVVIVILGKSIAVALGAFLSGAGLVVAGRAALSMAQIGEFSFIIAAPAAAAARSTAAGRALFPIAVAVAAATTLTTPFLVAASSAVARWIDRKQPRRLQVFSALYASWIERLRGAPGAAGRRRRLHRALFWLLIDGGI